MPIRLGLGTGMPTTRARLRKCQRRAATPWPGTKPRTVAAPSTCTQTRAPAPFGVQRATLLAGATIAGGRRLLLGGAAVTAGRVRPCFHTAVIADGGGRGDNVASTTNTKTSASPKHPRRPAKHTSGLLRPPVDGRPGLDCFPAEEIRRCARQCQELLQPCRPRDTPSEQQLLTGYPSLPIGTEGLLRLSCLAAVMMLVLSGSSVLCVLCCFAYVVIPTRPLFFF